MSTLTLHPVAIERLEIKILKQGAGPCPGERGRVGVHPFIRTFLVGLLDHDGPYVHIV